MNNIDAFDRKARRAESTARLGDLKGARALLDQLRAAIGDAAYALSGSTCLAEAEWQFRSGQTRAARPHTESALRAFQIAKNKVEVLRCREQLARIDMREGEESNARDEFHRVLDAWRRLERTEPSHTTDAGRGQGRCLVALVHLARRQDRFDEGLKLGEKLLPIARRFDHERILVNSLNALGGIHFALAAKLHPVASEDHHLTALHPTDTPIIRDHCEKAMTMLAEAATLASREGDDYLTAMLGSNLAQLQVLLGRPLEALPAMHAFLSHNRKSGNRYMECDCVMGIGWAQWAAGDFQQAEKSLMAALQIAESTTTTDQLHMIHYDLSRVLEALRKPAAALQHYREYARLRMRTHRVAQHAALAATTTDGKSSAVTAAVPRLLEPFYLKRAERFMAAHLQGNPGIVEIAADAGVSVRTLFAAFKKYRDTTPHAELQRLRLAAAHSDLQDGEFGGVTVATIAARWGFDDASRFAKSYRTQYGCTPSQTLRGMA